MADFADGAVAVVGCDVDQERPRRPGRSLRTDFVDLAAFEFACAAHDRALDVVGRHADGFGRGDGGAQARVGFRVAAAARGNHDFLDEASERFATLGVKRRLFVLDRGPFTVSRHRKTSRVNLFMLNFRA